MNFLEENNKGSTSSPRCSITDFFFHPVAFITKNKFFITERSVNNWKSWNTIPIFLRNKGISLLDRKSTRLNSSHVRISYAVFCLKKKSILFLTFKKLK